MVEVPGAVAARGQQGRRLGEAICVVWSWRSTGASAASVTSVTWDVVPFMLSCSRIYHFPHHPA